MSNGGGRDSQNPGEKWRGSGEGTFTYLPSSSWPWARYFPYLIMRPLNKGILSSMLQRRGLRIREVKRLAQVTQL